MKTKKEVLEILNALNVKSNVVTIENMASIIAGDIKDSYHQGQASKILEIADLLQNHEYNSKDEKETAMKILDWIIG